MRIQLFFTTVALLSASALQAQLLSPTQSEYRMMKAKTDVQLQQLNIAKAQNNRLLFVLGQLTFWTRKQMQLLDQPKPNVLQMQQGEHKIRLLRVQLKHERSQQLTFADILKRIIVQKKQQRRTLQRQPKTSAIQERIDSLNAQLQAARALQKRSTARPTPTPKVQLLSMHS